jgi:glycosyltransferase involved in cell wall biosynthesis
VKILAISSLYPNALEPALGIFVEQQIVELAKLAEVRVVAPVVLKPLLNVGHTDVRKGIHVYHPRRVVIPKTGRSLYGELYYRGIRSCVNTLRQSFDFDVVLGYFAYPDGYAAMRVCREHNKPLCVAALGSDIKVYMNGCLRRMLTLKALKNAQKVVAVSADLAASMRSFGVDGKNIVTIPNGVDTGIFYHQDTATCRRQLGLPDDKQIILFVGNLKTVKGVLYLVEACALLEREHPGKYRTILVGDGELRRRVEAEIIRLRMQQHILLAGNRKHSSIPKWINASNVVCLPSLSEGCPNIIMEAFACGRPVVATNVGGIPELVTSEEYGYLVPPADAISLQNALHAALTRTWVPEQVARRSRGCSWQDNARLLHEHLQSLMGICAS